MQFFEPSHPGHRHETSNERANRPEPTGQTTILNVALTG
jgi:hypothetical protein